MKALKNLILFISLGFVAVILFGWYSGFFFRARVEVKTAGPFVAVYEDHVGAYSETREIRERIYDRLWEDGIENFRNFGIYYDDPRHTDVKDLRSKVGRVVENEQLPRLKRMKGKYKLFRFPAQTAAVVEVPYRNSFSLYAGIYKAYPMLREFADENGYANDDIIEIHDIPDKIIFILPFQNLD